MTRAEIDKYVDLMVSYNKATQAYRRKAGRAYPGSSGAQHGPRGSGVSRKVEDLGIELSEYADLLNLGGLKRDIEALRPAVFAYVNSLASAEACEVLTLRVLEGREWKDVAAGCGPGVSVSAARRRFERALAGLPER